MAIGFVQDLLLTPALKLAHCPRSLAPTLVALPSMSLIPFAPFGDVMANEAGAIVRGASTVGDRGYKRTLSQLFVMLYVSHV